MWLERQATPFSSHSWVSRRKRILSWTDFIFQHPTPRRSGSTRCCLDTWTLQLKNCLGWVQCPFHPAEHWKMEAQPWNIQLWTQRIKSWWDTPCKSDSTSFYTLRTATRKAKATACRSLLTLPARVGHFDFFRFKLSEPEVIRSVALASLAVSKVWCHISEPKKITQYHQMI